MKCFQCDSNDCIHVQTGDLHRWALQQRGAVVMNAQQQSMEQYMQAMRNYAGTEMANLLGQEMSKAYIARPKKKLLLLRK